MHVLITADTVGGVWTYTRDLISELLKGGHRITLMTLGRQCSAGQQSWIASTANSAGSAFRCVETNYKLEWMAGCEQDLDRSGVFLLDLIDQCKPDLLHFNQFSYGTMKTDLPKVVVAHSDVLSWMSAVYKNEKHSPEWIPSYKTWVSDGLHNAQAVVAPSRWMASELNRIYGHLPHLQVILNGRSINGFTSCISKHPQAASVGRLWDKGKNMALFEKVRSRMPIWIIGDARAPDDGEPALLPRKDKRTNIHYLPSTEESAVCQLMRESAVYVTSSIYEPFGLAPVEAALSGCAVVCSDIPSLREIWDEAAFYYPPDDAAALSGLLDHLLDNPDTIRQYAHRARKHAVDRFNAKRMAAEYMRLYEELLKGNWSANETATQNRDLCTLSAL